MSEQKPNDTNRATLRIFAVVAIFLISNCSGGGGAADAPIDNAPRTATLTWDEVNAGNLTGYRVYFGTVTGTYIQPLGQGLNAGNGLTYTVTGLNRGTRYFFAVTGYDDISGFESGFSGEVSKVFP